MQKEANFYRPLPYPKSELIEKLEWTSEPYRYPGSGSDMHWWTWGIDGLYSVPALTTPTRPKADGTIPENQLQRLTALGDWLKINGEGIYNSKPHIISSAKLEDGTDIRFTQKGNDTFIFFLSQPKTRKVFIPSVSATEMSHATLLRNKSRKIPIRCVTSGIELRLPIIRHFQFAQMIRVHSDK